MHLTLSALVLRVPVPGVKQAAAISDDLVALVAGVVGHALVSRLFPLLAPRVVLVIVIIIIEHLRTNNYIEWMHLNVLTCGIDELNTMEEVNMVITFMLKINCSAFNLTRRNQSQKNFYRFTLKETK